MSGFLAELKLNPVVVETLYALNAHLGAASALVKAGTFMVCEAW